ncbi:MAG: hypothetical protein DRI32_00005, partial [Chloroflexi bacterium]
MPKKLKVFLCHSSNDKPAVREIYKRLKAETWIEPWLDEEELFPGQDWGLEIEKAVEETDTVLVFLSNNAVTKKGYVQKELRMVLRISDYQPDGTIFTIPLRLEKCAVPRALSMWQYLDLFPETRKDWAYKRLLGGLKLRAKKLGIDVDEKVASGKEQAASRQVASLQEKKARESVAQERIEKRARELAIEIARKEREEREKEQEEEKARKLAKEIVRKAREKELAEEKARKEKEALEKKLAEEKARKEKEAREKKLAEEKARKAKEIARKAREKKLAEEARKKKLAENPAGIEWIKIPAGKFTMGSNDYVNEKPPHNVYLDEYLIAKTPTTNAQFRKFIEAGGYENKAFWSEQGWEWCLEEKRTHPYLWNDKKWS